MSENLTVSRISCEIGPIINWGVWLDCGSSSKKIVCITTVYNYRLYSAMNMSPMGHKGTGDAVLHVGKSVINFSNLTFHYTRIRAMEKRRLYSLCNVESEQIKSEHTFVSVIHKQYIYVENEKYMNI